MHWMKSAKPIVFCPFAWEACIFESVLLFVGGSVEGLGGEGIVVLAGDLLVDITLVNDVKNWSELSKRPLHDSYRGQI
jgi:hypothetical protein